MLNLEMEIYYLKLIYTIMNKTHSTHLGIKDLFVLGAVMIYDSLPILALALLFFIPALF